MRIDVADLLAHPGARRHVEVDAVPAVFNDGDGLVGSAAAVTGRLRIAVTLERIPNGIVARGEVVGSWHGECSSCLRDLDRPLRVHVDELFEPEPLEGETYPIEGNEIDLEQLVRDNVLLELPLAPHCEMPCAPAGAVFSDDSPIEQDDDSPADPPRDPRWAALAELEL